MLTGFVSRAWNTRGGRRLLAMLMSVGVMIGLWSSLVEPQQLQVRETVLTGLPEGAEPVRLAGDLGCAHGASSFAAVSSKVWSTNSIRWKSMPFSLLVTSNSHH